MSERSGGGIEAVGDAAAELVDTLALRRAVLDLVEQLPAGAWFGVTHLLEWLQRTRPTLVREQLNPRGVVRLQGLSWSDLEQPLLRYFLLGPLYWLGLVAASRDGSAVASRTGSRDGGSVASRPSLASREGGARASSAGEASRDGGSRSPDEASLKDGSRSPDEASLKDGSRSPDEASRKDGSRSPDEASLKDGSRSSDEALQDRGFGSPREPVPAGGPLASGEASRDDRSTVADQASRAGGSDSYGPGEPPAGSAASDKSSRDAGSVSASAGAGEDASPTARTAAHADGDGPAASPSGSPEFDQQPPLPGPGNASVPTVRSTASEARHATAPEPCRWDGPADLLAPASAQLGALLQAERYLVLRERGRISRYYLVQTHVAAALGAGGSIAECRRLLQTLTRAPLPDGIAERLAAWDQRFGALDLRPAVLLEARSSAELDLAIAEEPVRPFVRHRLGSTTAEVAAADALELAAALRAGGHLPRVDAALRLAAEPRRAYSGLVDEQVLEFLLVSLMAFESAWPERLAELEGSAALIERLRHQFPPERLAELRQAAQRLAGTLSTSAAAARRKRRRRSKPTGTARTPRRPGRPR